MIQPGTVDFRELIDHVAVAYAHGGAGVSSLDQLRQEVEYVAGEDYRWIPGGQLEGGLEQIRAFGLLRPDQGPQPILIGSIERVEWLKVDADLLDRFRKFGGKARLAQTAELAAELDGAIRIAEPLIAVVVCELSPEQVEASARADIDNREAGGFGGDDRESEKEVGAAAHFVSLGAPVVECVNDGALVPEAEVAESRKGLAGVRGLAGKPRVEISERVLGAGQEEALHRGEQKVCRGIATGFSRDLKNGRVVGDLQGELPIQRAGGRTFGEAEKPGP